MCQCITKYKKKKKIHLECNNILLYTIFSLCIWFFFFVNNIFYMLTNENTDASICTSDLLLLFLIQCAKRQRKWYFCSLFFPIILMMLGKINNFHVYYNRLNCLFLCVSGNVWVTLWNKYITDGKLAFHHFNHTTQHFFTLTKYPYVFSLSVVAW